MFITRSRNVTTLLLAVVFPVMSAIAQESHVVPLAELHRDAAAVTASREANLQKVERFVSSETAQKALHAVKLDGNQVTAALPLLGDEELAQLASRADQAQADFAAGALTNQQITYIIIALATAVIILVIVAR
jgi:hypothetical protein